MTRPIRIAILGSTGRLGRAITAAILDSSDCQLVGAMVRSESSFAGHDIGEILERARSADPVPPRFTRFFFLHEKWRDSGMHERADLVEF